MGLPLNYQEKLKNDIAQLSINAQSYANSELTAESILADWEKSKEITGTGLITNDEEAEIILQIIESKPITIETFFSVPFHVEWRHELKWDILVTDDSKINTHSDYGWIGNVQPDSIVTGTIQDIDGNTIYAFNGITDNYGYYVGSFIIPDNISTRDEYTITADITFEDSISTVTDVFFVVPSDNGSNINLQPIAITDENPLIPILNGSSITLNATNSYDPDGVFSELVFFWSIIGNFTHNFQLLDLDTDMLGFFDSIATIKSS